jgi:hypothetical protein
MSNRRFILEVEALPSTNGTVVSRLRRMLKTMGWYNMRRGGFRKCNK